METIRQDLKSKKCVERHSCGWYNNKNTYNYKYYAIQHFKTGTFLHTLTDRHGRSYISLQQTGSFRDAIKCSSIDSCKSFLKQYLHNKKKVSATDFIFVELNYHINEKTTPELNIVNLMNFIVGYSPEIIDGENIDIAIEINPNFFRYLGMNAEADQDGYIENELGNFYVNHNNITWIWVITNKTINSRDFSRVGNFYLTDSETGNRLGGVLNRVLYNKFKKAITPYLNKALLKFYKEEIQKEAK